MSSVTSSSSSDIFFCDMNTHYSILGSGSHSLVMKPYVKNIKDTFYNNAQQQPNHESVAKIYTEKNKDDFEKEIATLQKISHIDRYTDFTVPFISASSFDIKELQNELDILKKLKIDDKNKQLYQIVLGYGGVSLSRLNKEYLYVTLPFGKFMKIIREFYSGIEKLHNVGIIHRDIKPENVLFDQSKLYIVDFNISCDVQLLYTNDPDQMYILSYMYMYNAPEFYIAYLMFRNEEKPFQENLKKTFDQMGQYSKELDIFYYEHYYRYNSNEPYNIFSYQQGFSKFYDMIKNKDISSIQDLFTEELAFKSDIYSTYFVLKQLKKYIIFENLLQKHIFNTLCDMTSAINPFERSNTAQILNYLDKNMFC